MKFFSMFTGIGTGEKGIGQAFDNQYEPTFAEPSDSFGRGQRIADERGNGVLPANDAPLRRSGAECVGFSEIDRHAEAIYRYHWPGHRNYGDATRIIPDDLPDFDFLIGGFPCQAFSIAGKRQGFNEARGTLFFEIARVLSHKRPGHFLLENVKGLLSHDGGETLHQIFRILAELGYRVELVVLNSKDYGVPQNRERCFFIGHLAGGCAREILSVGENDAGAIEGAVEAAIANCFTAGGNSGGMHSSMTLLQMEETKGNSQGARVYKTEGIASGLKSQGGGGSAKCPMILDRDVAIPVLTPDRPTKRQNGRRMKEDGEEAFTLTAQDRHGVFTGRRIRRLTPIECERLQGLPDDFTKYGRYGDEIREVSDTQRYKGLGNAFTVNVIETIVGRMLEKGCLSIFPAALNADRVDQMDAEGLINID